MATSKPNIERGRYRGLIISIALLLSLIGALLVFTFYTSNLIERNTVLISETNQVANDAQAISKDLFDLANSYGEDTKSPHMQRVLTRLQENSDHITDSLVAVRNGEAVMTETGTSYKLPIIKDQETIERVETAQEEWSLLHPPIVSYLKDADNVQVDSYDDLSAAVDQAKTSSLIINQSLDDLTHDVFVESQRQAQMIRRIQILGVIAILTYFLIFVFFFVRRLRNTDAKAEEARRETQEIMHTVSTGLFLLDEDLKIGQQYSNQLVNILETDRIAGKDFTNILRGRISDKDLETTRQFIEQLYNPRVKEKLVNDLNPLNKVMLHSTSSDSAGENRYLDFRFSRVYEGDRIARILVNVMDVSDAVRLENRLEHERTQNDMQIEMLTTILNVNPNIINEFIQNTKAHISKINNILKNPGSSQFELESKLKSIYREVHSLKGEASALKLHTFTRIASEAENKQHSMQNQGTLSGNDFLPLAVHLDDLINLSNMIEALGERINQSSVPRQKQTFDIETDSPDDTDSSSEGDFVNIHGRAVTTVFHGYDEKFFKDFAYDIAERQGKSVELKTTGIDNIQIPASISNAVKDISIQLLRNAIVHGIEKPEERKAKGKSPTGLVTLNFDKADRLFTITLKDDGQGVDYDKVRQQLIEKGAHSKEVVNGFSENELLSALFSSGFTTRAEADEDGGRGVGLDIVKQHILKLDGKIKINSKKDTVTRFIISLPFKD